MTVVSSSQTIAADAYKKNQDFIENTVARRDVGSSSMAA